MSSTVSNEEKEECKCHSWSYTRKHTVPSVRDTILQTEAHTLNATSKQVTHRHCISKVSTVESLSAGYVFK